MSHFTKDFTNSEGKKRKIEYRFDFYEQSDNSIAYKDDFDNCPELDIDFENVTFEPLMEKKPAKYENKKIEVMYYPGFTLKI